MARTALEKIGTDRRFHPGFLVLGVSIAILLGPITGSVAVVAIALGLTAILSGLCRQLSLRGEAAQRR
jgi:hypothetical protein